MAIDPNSIVWEEETVTTPKIDASSVVWDDGEAVNASLDTNGQDRVLNIDIVDNAANRAAAQKALVNDMSGTERFIVGAGKSLVDNAIGAGQILSSEAAPYLYGIPGLVTREIGRRGFGKDVDAFAQETAERDAPLMDTGAGLTGNIAGNIAQIVGPGIASRGTTAASAILPTTIRGNAIQGAMLGGLQPTTQEGQRLENAGLGALFGGGAAGLTKAAGSAYRGARNVLARGGLTSTDRRAANVLAREATDPNITVTESAVPGVQRTLGESSNDPGLMALENTLRAQNRGAFEAQDIANNVARQRQIQGIAGSGADMAAAMEARDEVVDTTLQQALREGASYQQALQAAQKSNMQSAQQAAEAAIAENERLAALGLQGRVPVPEVPTSQSSVSDELASLRQSVSELSKQNAPRKGVKMALDDVLGSLNAADDSVGSLYLSRKYINDLIEGKLGSDKGYARTAQAELIGIREQLDKVLGSRAPSFPQYVDAYKEASKPINRMQVGRQIAKNASVRARDESGVRFLTPDKVFGVMDDLDAVAQKATGFKKAKASEILLKEDLEKLRAIQDDMQRISQRGRSATPGSPTMERRSIGERTVMKGLTSRLPWVGQLFEHFEGAANQRLNERLAFLMANPSEAQRVLKALPKDDASALRTTLNQLALATNRGAGTTATQK